jgi:hypothetical protein
MFTCGVVNMKKFIFAVGLFVIQAGFSRFAHASQVHVSATSWAWTVDQIDIIYAQKQSIHDAMQACSPQSAQRLGDWIIHAPAIATHSEWFQMSEEGGGMMFPWEIKVEAIFTCR